MAMTLPPRRAEAGLTLVEILVVVLIMGFLSGITGLISGRSGAQALDLAEVSVRDAMTHACAVARSARSPCGVVFDLEHDRFTIVDITGTQVPDPLTKQPYVVSFSKPGEPHGIAIDAADFGSTGIALVFDAQGVPLAGGTVTLLCDGLRRSISCNGATGELTAQDV